MSIIVIAEDEQRAEILKAGLELSGYHHDVVIASTPEFLLNTVEEYTPRLLVIDYLPDEQETIFLDAIQSLNDIPVMTIGESQITGDVNLSFPYKFQDFLNHVYDLAPLPTPESQRTPYFVSQEESEAKYRDLFDRASDAIFLIDLDTHIIVDANKQVEKMYGYSLDDVIGMSLLQIVPHNEHPAMLINTRKMGDERVVLYVTNRTHIKKDGSLLSVSISASLIEYGGRMVFQDIVRDETERIQQERELKRLNKIKDEFVSNISHELRTPLTSLNIRLHMMKKMPHAMERHLSTLEREINRLETLIDNLLTLSRLDQGRGDFTFSTFDVNDIVQEYYSDRQPVAEDAELRLKHQLSTQLPYVHASRTLLGQVLSIFLTNAINYTPPGGQITLKTDIVEEDGKQWVIMSVSDTGKGISQAEQKSLFKRFFRGKVGYESKKSGTGLGLAIAKEIIDRHDGRITVESDGIPGKGTTFSVWLSFVQQPHMATR